MPILDGYVIANIPAGVATGMGGGTNLASTSTDNSVLLLASLNAIWYSALEMQTSEEPIWYTYSQAIAHDEYNIGWGPKYVKAWTDEYSGMAWPTYAAAITDDARLHLGPDWFVAYWAQSSKPSYDTMVSTYMNPVWNSKLDTLSSSTNMTPFGDGTTFTNGGNTYLKFTKSGRFFTGKVTGNLVLSEVFGVGPGGSGGKSGGDNSNTGGGGSAGEARTDTSVSVDGMAVITIPAGGSHAGGGGNIIGGDGPAPTTCQAVSLLSWAVGVGGGAPTISGGNGKSGFHGSGGAGSSSGEAGTAGSGSSGRNGGNATGAAYPNYASGGGAGMGGSATSAVTGTAGNGGAGVSYAGSNYAGGGGGGGGGGVGGSGVGGNGGAKLASNGASAVANSGGGGGGCGGNAGGGSGGSGIVILRLT